jgi:zinc/manganese transport system substrate-binding protein
MNRNLFIGVVLVTFAAITAQARLNVVATTADLGALAAAIGGDDIDLTTLAKPTEDPHFVDAKPSYMVKLNRADVLIEGGAELEVGWLPPLVEGARNSKIESGKPGRVLAVEGISLLEIPATLDRSKGDIHAAGNPHFLTDPENALIVSRHICNSFCELDRSKCDAFKARLATFAGELKSKMTEWHGALAPYKNTRIVTYHDFWPYFARQYELKIDLFLEPKPGIPPTPAHLAEVISQMKSQGINIILVEPRQNRKTAEAVASHAEARLVEFPQFPDPTQQGYIAWMDGLVGSLKQALAAKK